MPGMMDTILDIGLCEATLPAIARMAGEAFAWETYGRLVRMFGTTVTGITGATFEAARLRARRRRAVCAAAYLAVFAEETGEHIPDDPWEQLREAVAAVFGSWQFAARAERYRDYAGISDDLGTAVRVQAMVFGNLDDLSGTGVRSPATP